LWPRGGLRILPGAMPRSPARAGGLVSPLASWFPDEAAIRRLRGARLGRAPALHHARDATWRVIAPPFAECRAMAASGLPFQIAADRRYDRSGDPRALPGALARGKTVYLPQVHQVLPRLARLMVALRAAVFGPGRDECSFLFLVEGTGRPGMGLHHDGEVDAVWLQLEGRRTVTLGPPVAPGTPEDLDDGRAAGGRRAGWRTRDLEPGTLLYLPPRTPHAVVCRGRSLAVTLTWGRALARRPAAAARRALVRWDVVSGYAEPIPPAHRATLWTQVPVAVAPGGAAGGPRTWIAAGAGPAVARPAARWARRLAEMPRLPRRFAVERGLGPLLEAGILGDRDLPRRIRPADPAALDGWRFA
jgi:mannose-6-phosphate isomerase-like protein (cupin superfamily)